MSLGLDDLKKRNAAKNDKKNNRKTSAEATAKPLGKNAESGAKQSPAGAWSARSEIARPWTPLAAAKGSHGSRRPVASDAYMNEEGLSHYSFASFASPLEGPVALFDIRSQVSRAEKKLRRLEATICAPLSLLKTLLIGR